MIDVIPSNKPYNNANIRAAVPLSVEKEDNLRDESPSRIPPKQSDTQLKMAKLGER